MRPNLKAYQFIVHTVDHRGRLFEVLAPNFAEACRTARATVAPRFAAYAGTSMSLPGVKAHALRPDPSTT